MITNANLNEIKKPIVKSNGFNVRQPTFIALHTAWPQERELECLANPAGPLPCRVSGATLDTHRLFKQDEERTVTLADRLWHGKLGFDGIQWAGGTGQ